MTASDFSMAKISRRMLSAKAEQFTESVIREMTRLALKHGAVNLSQGFPDFAAPEEIKEAARRAIADDINQYAITWGAKPLRDAIVKKFERTQGVRYDPEREVTICCGSTEAMMSAMMAIINPGDEIVVFEPFYENYGPDAILSGATPHFVKLRTPDWSFDEKELAAAFGPHTRAIILNTPNNPTGKVFSRPELEFIAGLCQEFDAYALADEIYEYIIYTDEPHLSIGSLPGMAERTVTISGLSKTFSITGWRLGYCIAPADVTRGIRKVHDFMTVGAPHPLQVAAATALGFPQAYYDKLREDYRRRRGVLLGYLRGAGFEFHTPDGAYYVVTDIARLGGTDDVEFVRKLVTQVGVAAVPGSSFYSPKELGRTKVRFMWAKRDETLHEAGRRLLTVREKFKT